MARVGEGKTAVTWKAVGSAQRPFAIKFALRAEYHTHSLEAEIDRANQLNSPLIAKIAFYGVPQFPGTSIDGSDFYAIVVDWIDGPTLRQYLTDAETVLPDDFRQFARDLCEILKALQSKALMHNDLHDRNIVVAPVTDSLTNETSHRLVAIDTGQLKTEETRTQLLEKWHDRITELSAIAQHPDGEAAKRLAQLRGWVSYFSRTDQEWISCHLCAIYNRMLRSPISTAPRVRRFLQEIPELLRLTIDPDPSRRVDDPLQIYRDLESLWQNSGEHPTPGMQSPFDLPSAELIRSDRQLMDLFAEEYPRLSECRSNSPVYIYGPRGCGKSTLLRSISLKAILQSKNPPQELAKVQFSGVYVSCSSELRSRFWLVPPEDYEPLAARIVRYFTLLLVEELVDTLDRVYQQNRPEDASRIHFGLTDDLAQQCCARIRARLELPDYHPRHFRASIFGHLRSQVREHRDALWRRILRREAATELPNAQLVFDITRDLELLCPFLQERRLAFLLDDYSNQRIPVVLQRMLNQSITFAKQGSPIFKVSSEYDGVDLEGIQEGREVREVNVGFEYVSLQGSQRWRFPKELLERRFAYLEHPVNILDILPLSNMQPAISMAKAILAAVRSKGKFYYHGIDTISDLCSGDFAMALDLVRRIFEHGDVNWKEPKAVPPQVQHRAIREYASREFEYIRYRWERGLLKYEIVDRLCWLSHKCVLEKTRRKDGEDVPLVKNHIDVAETALQDLHRYSREHYALLEEMIRKGILFPLETSKSREAHQGTRRYMVRRILLARYDAPLGRDVPIRIDDLERLRTLLTDPRQFADSELRRTNPERVPEAGGADNQADPQKRLF